MANNNNAKEYRKRRRLNDDEDIADLFSNVTLSDAKNTKTTQTTKTTKTTQDKLDEKHESNVDNDMNGDEDDKAEFEVRKVVDHRVDEKGNFSWLIQFDRYNEPEWIEDHDCSCEIKIQEYLTAHAPYVRTVYGVCRVSTKNQQGPTHVSLAAQEAEIRLTAADFELQPEDVLRVKIVSVVGSAYNGIPRQIQYIAEVAKERDILVVYRIDRLSRNIVRFLSVLEDMCDKGVLIYSRDEDIWYHTDKLKFIDGIVKANMESELLGKRTRQSIDYRRRRGDYIGSLPYGFKRVRDEKTSAMVKVEDPEEQDIIKTILKRKPRSHVFDYIHNVPTLITQFNRRGITKRGRPWTEAMIKRIRHEDEDRRMYQ